MSDMHQETWPRIRTAGYDGLVVSFADRLSEQANRAALAFRDAVETRGWEAVEESSTSLVSAYLRFDPLRVNGGAILGHGSDGIVLSRAA